VIAVHDGTAGGAYRIAHTLDIVAACSSHFEANGVTNAPSSSNHIVPHRGNQALLGSGKLAISF
jgi:hypothetical protein